jgi:large subunit ribosomal protein L18
MAVVGTDARARRHRRIRGKVVGSATRPRLSVARSNKRIYAQLIDDASGHTLAAAGSNEEDLRNLSKAEAAGAVGARVAERGREAGIEQVVFDRAGYRYHGRVARLAEAAREAGLDF